MPLPPLPANNTARFKTFYTTEGFQHVLETRVGTISPATFGGFLDVIWSALSPLLYQVTIDRMEYAGAGTDVFFPVTSGIEGNTYGSGSGNSLDAGGFISLIGRSAGGRRARQYFYGAGQFGANYRFSAGESAAIDGAVLAIQSPAQAFWSIDNQKPTWYTYANAGRNAYWQRKVR